MKKIKDVNGVVVKVGDYIQIPQWDYYGGIYSYDKEKYEVLFRFGALGIFLPTKFKPLMDLQETKEGEYIGNYGCKTIYTQKYYFRIVNEGSSNLDND